MGNSNEHFLKMSGKVPPGKHKEFEQTLLFVSNHLYKSCLQFNLSADIFNTDLYHFYSLWASPESLESFCKSQEFYLIQGAFETLGSLEKSTAGELIDLKCFQITDMAL